MKPVLVLPLGRPTFDVPYAEEMAAAAFKALDSAGVQSIGPRDLLFDADAARAAIAAVAVDKISAVLLLQVTFTDASMTVEIAKAYPATPLSIWAFPEPRAGGRLRLNSFCGLNLASHALGRAGRELGWLYAAPDAAQQNPEMLQKLLRNKIAAKPALRSAKANDELADKADKLAASVGLEAIGLVGEHPAGFDTCRYDQATITRLGGGEVKPIPLSDLFARARAADAPEVKARIEAARAVYAGLDGVDQEQLEKSLALHVAMEGLKADHQLGSFAVRCWPETFTEYGCAICGPMGMMGEAGTPCACEADVLGAFSTLLMQNAAGQPAWLVDIVDMDEADESGVFWHCGSAPISMRDPASPVEAQIHSNRKMPLLGQFTLKPGRITMARITQTGNRLALVLGGGEVIRAPMSFTGTSAVVRFDGGVSGARDTLINAALEHHVAIVYGEHRPLLEAWAARKGLSVLDLTR